MWTALATIGISLGIGEASKLLNEVGLSPTKAQAIANKILGAAEKKGAQVLNKALAAVQAIPQLAGSPSIKEYVTKARNSAERNYNNVEKAVFDMKTNANNAANEVVSLGNQSILQKGWNAIKGNSNTKQAEDIMNKSMDNIEQSV